jgi:hypothetical protein
MNTPGFLQFGSLNIRRDQLVCWNEMFIEDNLSKFVFFLISDPENIPYIVLKSEEAKVLRKKLRETLNTEILFDLKDE